MGMRAKEVAGEDLHDGHVNYGHDYGSDGYIQCTKKMEKAKKVWALARSVGIALLETAAKVKQLERGTARKLSYYYQLLVVIQGY